MRPLFEFLHEPLLKLDLGPLARYGNHEEAVSGKPGQKYLPSDPRLEWPAKEPLLKHACFRKASACLSRQIKISTS